jgi:hypothetical protein
MATTVETEGISGAALEQHWSIAAVVWPPAEAPRQHYWDTRTGIMEAGRAAKSCQLAKSRWAAGYECVRRGGRARNRVT